MGESIFTIPQKASKRHISWPHLALALIGITVSAYAVHVHQVVAAGGDSACGISATVNCDTVIGSKYGVVFGLPLGIWGMVYFALLLLASINDAKTAVRTAILMRAAVTAVGFLTVLGLAYISYIVIKVTCPVCMTVHILTTLAFLYSLYELWRMRRHKSTFMEES